MLAKATVVKGAVKSAKAKNRKSPLPSRSSAYLASRSTFIFGVLINIGYLCTRFVRVHESLLLLSAVVIVALCEVVGKIAITNAFDAGLKRRPLYDRA